MTIALATYSHGLAKRSYSTSFPATENPIDEGGRWRNGGAVGIDWTNMRTGLGDDGTTQIAYGTQSVHGTPPFDDSIACLSGYGPDHQITGTIYRGPEITNQQEVELHVRCSMVANSIQTYELDIDNRQTKVSWVRWDGAINSFVSLANTNTNVVTSDGAVWTARVVGKILTAICNGVTVLTYDTTGDSTKYSSGNPGIAAWRENTFGTPGPSNAYGWKNIVVLEL